VKQRPFLALWTLAVIATVAAFVLHLGLRGRTVDLGYKLGRARAEQARLREQKRVLSLEAASYETPQRVEMVARTLLGMNPPPPERVIPLKAIAPLLPPEEGEGAGDVEAPIPIPSGAPAAPGVSGGVNTGRVPGMADPVVPGAGDPAGAPVAGDAPLAPPTDVPAMAPLDPYAPSAPQGAVP
jgi:cell division protein FtsL